MGWCRVTNHDKGRAILREAEGKMEEAERWYARRDWNMTIRSCQEAVELALKGALHVLGIDYPKVHDVGLIFRQRVTSKIETAPIEDLERIAEASKWLDERRTLSFYRDAEYPQIDADRALELARFVLPRVKNWLEPRIKV